MPQPNKIPLPFAASGDKNVIPESTETTGLASWRDGFPAITSTPFSEGGIAPKRADFNGIFNALSAAAIWYQQGGFFVYDDSTNYEIGNIVIYSGEIYVCKTANGPASALHSPANDTAETYWGRIYPQNGTFDRMFFSQTSGTYTAPYTGVYRITLKGGGGGGAGGRTDVFATGASGGEGGTLVFYVTLTKNSSYPYVIGAGGAGGTSGDSATATGGSDGGTTSFNSTTTIAGGQGGIALSSGGNGGYGGFAYTIPQNTPHLRIPGSMGGAHIRGISRWVSAPTSGGANTGLFIAYKNRLPGCGGAGACGNSNTANPTVTYEAQAGNDGSILIEYAG